MALRLIGDTSIPETNGDQYVWRLIASLGGTELTSLAIWLIRVTVSFPWRNIQIEKFWFLYLIILYLYMTLSISNMALELRDDPASRQLEDCFC